MHCQRRKRRAARSVLRLYYEGVSRTILYYPRSVGALLKGGAA